MMKKFIFSILLISFTNNVFTQPTGHWTTTGNPAFGLDAVGPGNNFIGTNFTNNFAIRIGTFGISRISIQDNTGAFAGFIGMGNGFLNPMARLHLNGDGGIISSGNTFGTGAIIPAGLSNALLLWNPRKASFRAGYDTDGNWSAPNKKGFSAS